jgi:hypothetical protein
MADLLPVIETLENRWMRAWIARDLRTLKGLTSRKFMLVVGAERCVILDARSWMEAAATRYLCTSYRFGDIYARDLGPVALFASQLDLEATIDGNDFSGRLWVTDLWRKSALRRSWRLVERVVSRPQDNPQLPPAIRSMQLWR